MGRTIREIYGLLLSEYGEQGWWPIGGRYSPEFKGRQKSPAEKFEICIGAILAQNTSWKNAEKAVLKLGGAGALERRRLSGMGEAKIAGLIRSAGYYNMKARKIREFLGYSGEASREGLLSVWGMGEETVDSILLYAYGVPLFVADAYSRRVFSRVGLCPEDVSYSDVQGLVHSAMPGDHRVFNEYHALIVEHAKRHCRAKPKCSGCPLGGICKREGQKPGSGRLPAGGAPGSRKRREASDKKRERERE
jgi:endonuclease-3 related protein